MANNFSSDSRCKALWRFESGALTADSKGANTLTLINSPVADTVNYKEGTASLKVDTSGGRKYATINNSNLDAGFPLKVGDTVKKITICGWVRPTSVSNPHCPFCFGTYGGSLPLGMYYSSTWGELRPIYNGDLKDANFNVNSGYWYHFALVVDGVAGTAYLRVYNTCDSKVYTWSQSNLGTMNLADVPLSIGAGSNGWACEDVAPCDEMVVFNDLLSNTEIDAIRNGVFPLPAKLKVFQAVAQAEWEAPPVIEVFQVIGQAEYQVPPLLKATQNLTQVEYSIPPLIKVPQIIGQVEYRQFDPGLYVKQFIVQVEYQEIPPLSYRRKFPVPDARTAWQSQAGRRQFPVVQ